MDTLSRLQRSRVMSRIHGRDTGPEILIRSMVHRLGYRFRLHRKDLPGTPDLVFPVRRIAMFVHGCFWHGHDCSRGRLPSSNVAFWEEKIGKNKQRDVRVRKLLRKQGWKVLAVWQCETRDTAGLVRKLTRFLEASNKKRMKRSA